MESLIYGDITQQLMHDMPEDGNYHKTMFMISDNVIIRSSGK